MPGTEPTTAARLDPPVDVAHLSFKPPFVAGSYNRLVGTLLTRFEDLQQVAISFRTEPRPAIDPWGPRLRLVDGAKLTVGQRAWLRLPERYRGGRHNGIRGRDALAYAWGVLDELERLKPRVVVCYDGTKLGGLLRRHVSWPCRLVLAQRGHSYYLDARAHERLYSLPAFDAVWTLTEAAYRHDRGRGQLYEPTVHVIPNFVDAEVFRPGSDAERQALRRDMGLPLDRPLALLLGRLVPKKGAHVVVEAWDRVLSEVPGAFLWVVGAGPEAYRERLEGAARSLGVHDSVRFEGDLPSDRVPACHRAADVFVSPSLCTEGHSLSLLEAMSSGLPCIVSASPALSGVYQDDEVVFVDDPNMEGSFAGPLAELLGDETERRAQGERAREAVLERFAPEPILGEVHDFLERQLQLVGTAR